MGPQGPEHGANLDQGGFEFAGPRGVSHAPDLAIHADGLAACPGAEIAAMIVEGRRPDGSPMLPMP